MATGAVRAVLLRLAVADADLLDSLASQMRSGRSGIAAIALRHLAATIKKGQPVYVGESGPSRPVGIVASLHGAPVVVVEYAADEAGTVLVSRPQDALLEDRTMIKVKASELSVKVRFQPTRVTQPGQVQIVARDGSGNVVEPLSESALSFMVPLWSRLLAAPTSRPMPNKLMTHGVPLRALVVTGDDSDTVTMRSADDRVEVKGYGLRDAATGVSAFG